MTTSTAEPSRASAFLPGALAGDPELHALLEREIERQRTNLQLIASENFTSPAVLAASASVLTNKYSEGYPGRRYYGGNVVADQVEDLARARAMELFGAEHANVQPHAGANANLAAYLALVEPGDTILAMRLDQGGHLTHGSPVSITGKLYRFVAYGVTPAAADGSGERIDLDMVRDLAKRERPRLIVAGATAYSRVIDPVPFREIADEVGARFMFDAAHPAGLIAGKVHPNPVGVADVVTFTTHKTLRGPRGGAILCGADLAKAVDSAVFPGLQGGPLEHVIAAKAVAFGEALKPEFRDYAAKVVAQRGRARRGVDRPGLPARRRRYRQPPRPRRPAHLRGGADRQGRPGGARPHRDHLQPQRHPERSPAAVRVERPPARLGRGDDRRARRGGDGRSRRAHRPGPSRAGGRGRAGLGPRRREGAVRPVRPLPGRRRLGGLAARSKAAVDAGSARDQMVADQDIVLPDRWWSASICDRSEQEAVTELQHVDRNGGRDSPVHRRRGRRRVLAGQDFPHRCSAHLCWLGARAGRRGSGDLLRRQDVSLSASRVAGPRRSQPLSQG